MTDTITYGPPATPAAPEPDPGSLPRRVVDTFFSPIALFQRFGSRPPWLDVVILSIALGVVTMLLVPRDLLLASMEEAMRRQGGNAPPMDPEQMVGMQRTIGIAGAVIGTGIFLVLLAGLMTLVFSVVMGGRATFRQYVGVVAHAGLVSAVGQLATLPLFIQKGVMSPTGLSLGALAGGMDPDSFVFQFLNFLNVFTLWQVVLMGLGAATLNRRIGAGTAVGVLLAVYAFIAAVIAAVV